MGILILENGKYYTDGDVYMKYNREGSAGVRVSTDCYTSHNTFTCDQLLLREATIFEQLYIDLCIRDRACYKVSDYVFDDEYSIF